jgi:hypothetical protein
MSEYRPSPRPVFDHATALRGAEMTRHVWGDTKSGEVLDWLYVSSALIHQIVFGLPVGSSFRHSDTYRTGDWQIRGGGESGYVLEGVLGVRIGSDGGREFLELHPGDGWYVPKGIAHSYFAPHCPARGIFGVAPRFLAEPT